jgi:hypothetical protein
LKAFTIYKGRTTKSINYGYSALISLHEQPMSSWTSQLQAISQTKAKTAKSRPEACPRNQAHLHSLQLANFVACN